MAGIYIHVPFCRKACYYCDFHFSTSLSSIQSYTNAVCDELKLRQPYLHNKTIETIYLGGGTPSVLDVDQLSLIFDTIRTHFAVENSPEITIEVNPEDVNEQRLEQYLLMGINRLSMGIQTFNDVILKKLNRHHTVQQALNAVQVAHKTGFKNITIDLMYGLPEQTMEVWKQDVAKALDLPVVHISAYSLTIEPNTVFGRWVKKGRMRITDELLTANQLEYFYKMAESHGYIWYEISNFGKPGYFSRHNTHYWKNISYLGVGPSAHSYNGTSRQWNVANNAQYIKALQQHTVPCTVETLTDTMRVNEALLTGLRTMWGIDWSHISQNYGHVVPPNFYQKIKKFEQQKLLTYQNQQIILTHSGRFMADYITSELFI